MTWRLAHDASPHHQERSRHMSEPPPDRPKPRVLVVHGPNLNTLGQREPEVYGFTTLAEIDERLRERAQALDGNVATFQSNWEGALIDFLQAEAANAVGIVINPGGLTHSSVSLRDALAGTAKPAV